MNRTSALLVTLLVSIATAPSRAEEPSLADQAARFVDTLDADTAAERREAESALVALAGQTAADAERLLRLLPEPDDRMPPSVRSGIGRVRKRIERQLAESVTKASRITIDADNAPLAEVLNDLSKQSGNRLVDSRDQFGDEMGASTVSVQADDEPFWPVVDRLLDSAGLGVYAYGGAGELSLVSRSPGEGDRVGAAAYAGPFRFEPLRVVSTRGLRNDGEAALEIDLEIAWEPRLRPIALSQPIDELEIRTDTGGSLAPARPGQSLDVEVPAGSQAVELRLGLALPERDVKSIERVRGRLRALTPGRIAAFRFENIGGEAAGRAVSQREGDATVTLERFFRNNAIWELSMRLRLDGAGDALASHRGWVFQNTSYLVNDAGDRVEHAGFETTMQTENEVGMAYFFDFTDEETDGERDFDPRRLTWVYETPAGVVQLPVEYELKGIPLP